MPYFIVFPVVISRVPELQPLHDLGQRNLARLDQQMNVIAHEHVGINVKAVSLTVFFESFQIVFPIRVAAKDRLALIAPTNRMIKRPRVFHNYLTTSSPMRFRRFHQIN